MKIELQTFKANPAFGAEVVKTKYLNSGIEYAKDNRIGLKEKSDFVNALQIIREDKRHGTFEIKGVPGSTIRPCKARRWQVLLDGKKVFEDDGSMGFTSDGYQSIVNTIAFVRKFYGKKFNKMKPLESVENVKTFEKLLKDANDVANSELNSKIDEYI